MTIIPIVVTIIIFVIIIFIIVILMEWWVGRVIPWPASDPSLDSVELCHENQHCAPFADTLHHHHFQLFQDFQFKDNIDVYSR